MIATDFAKELTASAIAPLLSDVATYVHSNEQHEVYDLLNRKLTQWGHTLPHDFGESLVFTNEDRSVWQVKPSRPMIGANGKAQKYLCPTGGATGPYLPAVPQKARLLFGVPSEGLFWDAIEADTSQTIVLTEGGKKALSLISNGILAIALTGCDGSTVKLPDGTSALDPRLSRFFSGTRTIVIAMDSDNDPRTVSRVSRAIDKLASRIAEHNPEAIVRVARWEPKDGKGADDVIVSRGAGFMRDLLKSARRLSISPTFLNPTSPDAIFSETKQGPKLKEASFIADSILLLLGNTLAYDLETSALWHYGKKKTGVWTSLAKVEAEALIDKCIQRLLPIGTPLGWSDKILKSVYALLCARSIGQKIGASFDPAMCDADGNKMPRLIPMKNGVLNSQTRELLPHCPSYGHTHRLPYDYQPLAVAPQPIIDFLMVTQEGDESRVQVLRAFMRCLITGQASVMERFLELVGPGGTGKSKFSALMIALVGLENVANTSFEELTKEFTLINIKSKMLINIAEGPKFINSTSVSILKRLSGGDTIGARQLYTPMGEGFRPSAMVLIAANHPFRTEGDQSSGDSKAIERRRATVAFNNEINRADMDRDLIIVGHDCIAGKFAKHIPALFNWALDMDEELMELYVVQTETMCPAINTQRSEVLIQVNPLAQWADESLIFGNDFSSQIGKAIRVSIDTPDGRINSYVDSNSKLYPAYALWCEQSGIKPIALNRFTSDLISACKSLGHAIDKGRGTFDSKQARCLTGVMLGNPETQAEPEAVEEEFEYEEVAEQLEAVFQASPSLGTWDSIVNQPTAQLTNEGLASTIMRHNSSPIGDSNATNESTIENASAPTDGSPVL